MEPASTKSKLTKDEKNPAHKKFPVVGIGASAGGLEALESFFSNIADNCNMAFVVIQHLDPTHKGMLPELLQRCTKLEVISVEEGLKIVPNKVYVIPSNKSMSISQCTLHLVEPIKTHGLKLPIDYFFKSLADDLQEMSVGVILSGMGSDGSIGLQAIKEKSGLILVQEPATAKFDSMPQSAIKSVPVDFVAAPNELPLKIISYFKNNIFITSSIEIPDTDQSALKKIVSLLRAQTGHDFSQYKKSTLYRRIERRMGIHQINKIANYVAYITETPAEVNILFKELLIGVTNFFRDEAVWSYLRDKILPEVIGKLPDNYNFRAWVPGCSTGEEAYSLAIVFKEALDLVQHNRNITLQIFATDLDNDSIEKARRGEYPDFISTDVDADRLKRFFADSGNGYRINADIRETIVFAPQNVIKDPAFTKLDFISCRNMLIYMESDLQQRLMKLFRFCLHPEGLLLLGNSETIGDQGVYYTTVDSKLRIYRKSNENKKELKYDPADSLSDILPNRIEKITNNKSADIQSLADQLLLQNYAPPTVLVDIKGNIIYITGRTGDYLEPAAGKASMNIFAMARDSIRNELLLTFRKANASYEKVVSNIIKINSESAPRLLIITVQKIEKPEALNGMFIVVFGNVQNASESGHASPDGSIGSVFTSGNYEDELQSTKKELLATKEELQLTIREMQASHEDLNSTNEELQSANEELQSANEELTTSKEEMQSLNEELQTLNVELKIKVDDYIEINNDLKNLFDGTDIAILFLDKNLRIRRFTKQATKVIKLIPTDVGRPFTDIVTNLDYADMDKDAKEVLQTLVFIEKSIKTLDGYWYLVRIIPYRTTDDRIDGLVITFSDINQTKKLEFDLRETNDVLKATNIELEKVNNDLIKSERKFRMLFENMTTDFVLYESVDDKLGNPVDFRYLEANPAFEKTIGLPATSIIGKTVKELFPHIEPYWIDVFTKVVTNKEPVAFENYFGEFNKFLSSWLYHIEDKQFAAIYSDITERKQSEEKVQKLLHEKELLLKEVHHRVKNNMNTVFSLLMIQSEIETEHPSIKNALLDAASRVNSMMHLFDKLNHSEDNNVVSIKEYLSSFIDEIINIFPTKVSIKIDTQIDDVILGTQFLSPIGYIINELITNIMKYAFKDRTEGTISIFVKNTDNNISLIVADDGCGLPEGFSLDNTTGFGMKLVDMLVQQIKGTIKIERQNGTKFIIEFKI